MPNNQLNIISPDIRDFLLNKNLNLSETILNYGNNSWASGIGQPATIGLDVDSVKDSPNIVDDGSLYKDLNTSFNKYKNESSTADDAYSIPTEFGNSEYYNESGNNGQYDLSDGDISNKSKKRRDNSVRKNKYRSFDDIVEFNLASGELQQYDESNEGYIDKNGKLVVGGPSTKAGDIIGSVLRGQSIGFSPDGPEPSYDLRASLAGRVLGATGVIDDTPLGQIGATELARALANNAAFNVQQETLGKVNTSVSNILAGGNLFVPNNDITVPAGGIGQATDILQKISGFEVPRSFLPEDSTIFSYDIRTLSPTPGTSESRNQTLVNNTGKGQKNALFTNLNATILNGQNINGIGYTPTYTDGNDGVEGITYANKSEDYDSLVERQIEIGNGLAGDFTWASDASQSGTTSIRWRNDQSILARTEQLFNSRSSKTMINSISQSVNKDDDIQSSVTNDGLISKGNAVKGTGDKVFCRTWTSLDRYDKVENLQKNSGLNPFAGIRNRDVGLSVLDSNGFVRIAPVTEDVENDNIKRFMFSIENLAWMDELEKLAPCEIGPGDGIDLDRRGRIMWFPPYDLNFTDTSSVNWDSSEFIGRGEPVYTYKNTERTGTLSFKLVTDHASAYNQFKNADLDFIHQILFGCDEISELVKSKLTPDELRALEVARTENFQPQNKVDSKVLSESITFYFPNDVSEVNTNYENGDGVGIGNVLGDFGNSWINNTDNGLNLQFYTKTSAGTSSDFGKIFAENETAVFEIRGYASTQGNATNNQTLSDKRANNLKTYLKGLFGLDDNRFKLVKGEGETSEGTIPDVTNSSDTIQAKKARKCDVRIINDSQLNNKINEPATFNKTDEDNNDAVVQSVKTKFFSECSYFDKIEQDSPIVYKNIKEQIKYFQPAFHSITPEGLNSRLNFLLQCTRQGPTGSGEISPDNLAFGRPPICILRIGDFYHCKIVIDNVDFSFEPLVWDLNPEGIGVQPMLVDVNISFKFIGGSSLAGPIAKLQNAVSFNFFANTEMYDNRADSIINGQLVNGRTGEEGIVKNDNDEATSTKLADENQEVSNDNTNSDIETTSNDTDNEDALKSLVYNASTGYDGQTLYISLESIKGFVTDTDFKGRTYIQSVTSGVLPRTELKQTRLPAGGLKTDTNNNSISLTTGKTYTITVDWGNGIKSNKNFDL
jgi:outer membrane protein OmpA-like peptidoglycan-associated protein